MDLRVIPLLHGGFDLVVTITDKSGEKPFIRRIRILNIKDGQVSTCPDVPKELGFKVDSCGRLIIGEV